MFLEILQNLRENSCVSFIMKLQAKVFSTEHLWTTASEKYKARRNLEFRIDGGL